MQFFVGSGLDCVTSIATALLVALGFYLVFGILRVYNMAHGDFVMIGAYSACLVTEYTKSWLLGVVTAPVVAGSVGLLLESVIIRRLYGRSNLSTLLATWGVSLCLVESVRLTFGPSGLFVDVPTSATLLVGGAPYPAYSLITVGVAGCAALIVLGTLRLTRAGLSTRATIEDPDAAEAAGVDTCRVYRWTFTAGSSLCGLAGAVVAPVAAVTPGMGLQYTILSVLIVLVGGYRTLAAPVVGAILVAGTRSVLSSAFGLTTATIGMLMVVVVVLIVRPGGVMSTR